MEQSLVVNPIAKNNPWVFTGDFPLLVKRVADAYFCPVL